MSAKEHESDRRGFLKASVLAAAGTTLMAQSAQPAEPAGGSTDDAKAAAPGAIPLRPFGKTGRKLPILGMGGSAMVGIFSAAYGVKLLGLDQRVAMVRHAYDRGIRYFDTARVYGESESIMGRGLKGVRDECYVATKCHVADPAKVRECVETSLAELQMDCVDCIQLHSPAIERVGFDGAMKIHAELVKLRDEGLCRYLGLTTHVAFETVHEMIKTDGFDQVLLAYGYFRKGMDTMLSNKKVEYRELCMAAAHRARHGDRGHEGDGRQHPQPQQPKNWCPISRPSVAPGCRRPPSAGCCRTKRVSLLNIGASMPSDIDDNLAVLGGKLEFTNEDRELLADFARQAYESEAIKKMAVT